MKLLERLLSTPVSDSIDGEKENCSPKIVTSVTSVPLGPAQPIECGPDCYEVEASRRIHRPWTGKCRAKIQVAEPQQVERECWHCRGSTRCACIACCEGLPAGAGSESTCMICKGTGKALVWVH